MTIDAEQLSEQMNHSRYREGRLERLENGQWVPWPVLTIDHAGKVEAKRVATHDGRRRRVQP